MWYSGVQKRAYHVGEAVAMSERGRGGIKVVCCCEIANPGGV